MLIGGRGEAPVHVGEKIVHLSDGMPSVIKMKEKAVGVRHHLISRVCCVKSKNALFFVKLDCHCEPLWALYLILQVCLHFVQYTGFVPAVSAEYHGVMLYTIWNFFFFMDFFSISKGQMKQAESRSESAEI